MHLRPKATLIKASALAPLGLESFEEDDTKILRGDVFQANASIIRAYQTKSILVYGAVKTTINDQGMVWVYGKGH